MPDPILIKPHHFIDIITAIGRGQLDFEPHPYGHAVHTVAARLIEDADTLLQMESGADDICRPCIHNIDGLCDDTIDTSFRPKAPSSKREYNFLIDGRWCRKLDLSDGDRLSAREFCQRLQPLAGDLSDVYREIPKDRTAQRADQLQAGIQRFLEKEKGTSLISGNQ